MCHGKSPIYLENMITANLISMITADNLHAQLFVEKYHGSKITVKHIMCLQILYLCIDNLSLLFN